MSLVVGDNRFPPLYSFIDGIDGVAHRGVLRNINFVTRALERAKGRVTIGESYGVGIATAIILVGRLEQRHIHRFARGVGLTLKLRVGGLALVMEEAVAHIYQIRNLSLLDIYLRISKHGLVALPNA